MVKSATDIGDIEGCSAMSILARLNDVGIVMGTDGRYLATLDQLEQLVHTAKKSATRSDGTGARRAYETLMSEGCTQQQAADVAGVSQAALARYIKRNGLPARDGRRKAA
jgi:hypothetical protein